MRKTKKSVGKSVGTEKSVGEGNRATTFSLEASEQRRKECKITTEPVSAKEKSAKLRPDVSTREHSEANFL